MKMVCIKKGPWRYNSGGLVLQRSPNYGEIVTVEGHTEKGSLLLVEYAELNPGDKFRRSFNPTRFRPIVPDEPKAADREFINLIKSKEKTDA